MGLITDKEGRRCLLSNARNHNVSYVSLLTGVADGPVRDKLFNKFIGLHDAKIKIDFDAPLEQSIIRAQHGLITCTVGRLEFGLFAAWVTPGYYNDSNDWNIYPFYMAACISHPEYNSYAGSSITRTLVCVVDEQCRQMLHEHIYKDRSLISGLMQRLQQ